MSHEAVGHNDAALTDLMRDLLDSEKPLLAQLIHAQSDHRRWLALGSCRCPQVTDAFRAQLHQAVEGMRRRPHEANVDAQRRMRAQRLEQATLWEAA